jgi:hypothetical protein
MDFAVAPVLISSSPPRPEVVMNRVRAHGLVLLAALAACGSSTDNNPAVTQHLYVGDDQATGSLRVYALPLTASSAPVAAVPMNQAFNLGLNTTTLAVTDLSSNLYFFTLPISSSSTPYAQFAAGSDGTPIFLASGSLYQGGSGKINVYTPPFTNSSAPSSFVTTAGLSPAYLAIDPNGNVYEATGGNVIGVISGGTLTTTLTAAAGTQFRGLAASATQLFACEFLGNSNNIHIYSLPLTATAAPAVTISLGTEGPEGCSLDADGKLYVGTIGGKILVFSPPFSGTSTASVTLSTSAIIFGIAVGK